MPFDPRHLPLPLMQAGLAGYSDRAMRVVARRRGCPYAVTEALLDTILLNGGRGLAQSIDVNDEDHPVAGQIIGAEPAEMAAAAVILAERSYDVIDLNFACPVKKIKSKSRGGSLLDDVPRAVEALKTVRDAVPASVATSVSMRRGFDESAESREKFYAIADAAWAAGYASIRVHGRTVAQKYAGRSRRPFLAEVKAAYPDRFVWGSGDVFTAQDAVDTLATGVDGVWIARGAIGNPWVFAQTATLLRMKEEGRRMKADAPSDSSPIPHPPSLLPPTVFEQRDALAEHFQQAMEIHGEQLAGRRMRKMGIKYSRFHPAREGVKKRFINVRSLRDWSAVLGEFYATDGPGVWPAEGAEDEVNDGGTSNCEAA